MGAATAAGVAEAVDEGLASLRQAIGWNLQANHYPPLPRSYVEPVIKAIQAYHDEEPEADIHLSGLDEGDPLPRRARLNDDAVQVVSAADLLEATHSWDFVTNKDDDWDEDDEDDDEVEDAVYHGPREASDYLPKDDEA